MSEVENVGPSRDESRESFQQKNADIIEKAKNSHKDTFVHHDDDGKLSLAKKISYGAPQFSVTSLTMLIGIHGMMFYTKIGASTAFLAFFTALARSFDVVTDPLMGWVSDKARTKYGRRRPFMMAGCWGYALLFILLMSPPSTLSDTGVSLWFGFFYIIFYLFDTMSNVPHGALGPELSDDGNERNKVFFWSNIFKAMGILLAATGPVGLGMMVAGGMSECACHNVCPSLGGSFPADWNSTKYGNASIELYRKKTCNTAMTLDAFNNPLYVDYTYSNDTNLRGLAKWCRCRKKCSAACDIASSRKSFIMIALFFGLFYVFSIVNCVIQIHEREGSDNESPPIVPSLLATCRNEPFMGLLPAWVCDMTSYTMIGTMLPFYMEYVIRPQSVPECDDGRRAMLGMDGLGWKESELWCSTEAWLGIGLVLLMGANIVAMPFWLFVAKKLGKYRAWMAFNLATAVTNGLFVFVSSGSPKLCVMMAFLNGLPSGANFINDAMVADIIDYDEFLCGFRSEGRFTIFQTFIPKIVSVPSQAIPLALMSAVGFVSPINGVPQPQPEGVKWFIKVVFYMLPCAFALASWVIKRKFPIRTEECCHKIVEGNAIHAAGHPAVDPVTGKTRSLFRLNGKTEEKYTWTLDNFLLNELYILKEKGQASLLQHIKKQTLMFGGLTTFFILIVIFGVMGGLLENKSLSFLPSFSVIGFGISMTLTLVSKMRESACKSLEETPIPDDFTNRWIQNREGTYEEALNELSPTLAKDVRRKLKHALMVSNSLGMSSHKVVPFQNLAEEAQEAAPQGIATGITVEIPGAVPVTGEVIAPLAGGTSEAKAGPDTDVLMPLGKEGSAEEKDGGEKSIKLASADAMLDDFAFPDELRPKKREKEAPRSKSDSGEGPGGSDKKKDHKKRRKEASKDKKRKKNTKQ